MKYDVVTYPTYSDQWKNGEAVLATVDAADIDDAVTEAMRLVGATQIRWAHPNEDGGSAMVAFADPDPAMLAEHMRHDGEFGHRVKVTSYPHADLPSYDGPVTRHPTHKAAVTAAFRQLRREGVVARQRLACCSTCASAELADAPDAVFYHGQDASRAWSRPYGGGSSRDLVGDLCVRYQTETGQGTRDLGVRVMQALQANGLVVKWDGDPTTVVTVPADQSAALECVDAG